MTHASMVVDRGELARSSLLTYLLTYLLAYRVPQHTVDFAIMLTVRPL